MNPTTPLLACAVSLFLCGGASAGTRVTVTVTGTIEFNQINPGTLGMFNAGDSATMTFEVDSAVFTNSGSFPTRGYNIDESTFVLSSNGTQIGLQNPFQGTPYFVLRDNDPAVDGFMVSGFVDFPDGVALNQVGGFDVFKDNFYATYGGSTLNSLDILDALGTYAFAGLTVYNWTVTDGPFDAMSIGFESMRIECTGDPASTYCTGKLNSQGCTPYLSTDLGTASLSGGPFNVTAHDLLNNKPGLLFFGYGSSTAPFQGGTLCVAAPITRTAVQMSGGSASGTDCSGAMSIDLSAEVPLLGLPAYVYVQGWARDPGDAFGSSLTNAARVYVCP